MNRGSVKHSRDYAERGLDDRAMELASRYFETGDSAVQAEYQAMMPQRMSAYHKQQRFQSETTRRCAKCEGCKLHEAERLAERKTRSKRGVTD